MRRGWLAVGAAAILACGSGRPPPESPVPAGSVAATVKQPPAPPVPRAIAVDRASEWGVTGRYRQYLASYRDLTHAQLQDALKLRQAADPPLGFDPKTARYYGEVATQLQLSEEEQRLFAQRGVVSVDHGQRYSMGSAYFAIYARDLPVLITADSILHALHRSYREVLKQLEASLLSASIGDVLDRAHAELGQQAPAIAGDEPLATSLGDVDLYLTVARNLLRGAGAPEQDTSGGAGGPDVWNGQLLVPSRLGQDAAARDLLQRIRSLRLEDPAQARTALYGGRRAVDYSQFAPRGHYAETLVLRRYFRTSMWLGRSDLGFNLAQPAPVSLLEVDGARETRSALVLAQLIAQSGALSSLRTSDAVIDFMVGRSDGLGVAETVAAAAAAGVRTLADLGHEGRVERVRHDLIQRGAARQQIRSQVLGSGVTDTKRTQPPAVFQLFGQRFVIDGFVLSEVVFDSIVFHDEKQRRMLPQGLDVMAALGNDEAARLLAPELERYNYAANLLAARRTVDELVPRAWQDDLYNAWLGALRTLDDRPAAGPHFPRAMQGEAWRRKQLQAQLGSWAELRHDTVLYAKQSYTGDPLCGYPAAFVEPYPEFFAALGRFGHRAAQLLASVGAAHTDWRVEHYVGRLVKNQARYFQLFADIMRTLERLAVKELRAEPFSEAETAFLKRAIDIRGGGSGPPRYDGWYTKLLYADGPADWEPVVADVHTDPEGRRALEVAVGDVNFLVVAVDNEDDRAVYVGPIYSYYEFTVPAEQRLTDQTWQARLQAGKAPPRPAWTSSFQAKPAARQLGQRSPAPPPGGSPPALSVAGDAGLAALIARIEASSALYGAGAAILSQLERSGWRGSAPPGPKPPAPTSAAPFADAAFRAQTELALQRIRTRCTREQSSPVAGRVRYRAPAARLLFGSTGHVLQIETYPAELAGSAYGGCVAAELKGIKLPAFNELLTDRYLRLPSERR